MVDNKFKNCIKVIELSYIMKWKFVGIIYIGNVCLIN